MKAPSYDAKIIPGHLTGLFEKLNDDTRELIEACRARVPVPLESGRMVYSIDNIQRDIAIVNIQATLRAIKAAAKGL